MWDRLFAQDIQPELLIKLARLRQRLNRDSEMVNGVGHKYGSWLFGC
jgi:hypothetical protein